MRPRENIWRNGHTVTMHGGKEETAAPHDTETGPGKVCAGLSGGGKCGKLLAQSVSGIRMREHVSHSVRRGGNRIGRIGNRVQFTDGAAAVSTDGQIMAKAGHWGDPRRRICAEGVILRNVRVRRPALGQFMPRKGADYPNAMEKRPWQWYAYHCRFFCLGNAGSL